MRAVLAFIVFLALCFPACARNSDTLKVQPGDINVGALQKGEYSYLIYNKKSKDGPAMRMTLVKILVEPRIYHNRPAFAISQQWDRDTVIHKAYSVFDAKDFSTIEHDTWWKALGYSMKFDFEARKVTYKNDDPKRPVSDSIVRKGTDGFFGSLAKYNLNWHADLIVYQLLPYRLNRTFIINYYDPGFGKAEEEAGSVTGNETLRGRDGEKTDCWVLNFNNKDRPGSYERFWISKKSREVLKEEDFYNGSYRFKVKLGISG